MGRWKEATLLVLFMAGNAAAQQCDVLHLCTAGECRNGRCVGVPRNGGPCDDLNDCTANDTCVSGACRCVGDCTRLRSIIRAAWRRTSPG